MGKELRIKGGEKILATIRNFSATEKFIFGVFVAAIIFSALSLALQVNNAFLVPIPAKGGTFTEGIVGLPRYINPVLSFTDVDQDLSALVYAGLMKYENGKLIPDLAEKYEISEDGLVYTFTLRDEIRFHDGVPLTVEDVEFTLEKIQDNIIKSPRRTDWVSISVKKFNSKQIQFTLKQPYAPFLSNTTIGILPKHIWSKVSSDQFIFSNYNTEPIGAGPYKLQNIKRDSGGIPEYYTFSPFSRYHRSEAYISNITIYFYPNEKSALEAYHGKVIGSIGGISPGEAAIIASTTPDAHVLHSPLPRVFGIFFNQNQAFILTKSEIRKALDMALDKDLIVEQVLLGYGVRNDSPLPLGTIQASSSVKIRADVEGAKNLLSKAGWTVGIGGILEKKEKTGTQTLEFSISTADSPDLKKAAEIIKAQWEKIGARVTIKVFEYGDLYQNIIATRKYDALLFGEFIGKDLDLYAFWHSSQRNAPGLNVAMYVNERVDRLLQEARTSADEKIKNQKYEQFEKIIRDEVPAIFLYSPEFIYVVPKSIHGIELGRITTPSDRFSKVNSWYAATHNVWRIFVDKKNNKNIEN